ncbi:MAG: TonB-dependent receptor [Opitutales bacterium]|nr:TonB-dependent receptor [Opitutales bacterium]
MNTTKRLSYRLPATLCLAVAASIQSAYAQTVEEDVYILSPFTVESSQDIGYLAQNTLAGSRLNTSLKDTGAAISVMTPEFLEDVGATSMKDIILFSSNSVPDYGDAAPNFNANPMIGNQEWMLRIRGMDASYARNYFESETPSDFYNVSRVDQSRGPNAILFGFGSAGGIVNTTTKQASLDPIDNEVSFTIGSWDRMRGTVDVNQVVLEDRLAVRVNAMDESSHSWRQYETYDASRIHLAATLKVTDKSTLRAEFENGVIRDNVARPWLMIDQTLAWNEAGSQTYDSAQWDSDSVTQTWSNHLVYVENDGTLMDWNGMPFSYSSTQNWSHLAMTDENLDMIPIDTNSAGPGAIRKNNYHTYTAAYEAQITDDFSVEVAYNHQWNSFRGYDANAGNLTRYTYMGDATCLWADASNYLPTWSENPYAGMYYLENNWTRRTSWTEVDNLRATAAYDLDLEKLGHHRIAVMAARSWRDSYNVEESEVFLGSPYATEAEFDSNRVFRRYYFTEGDASDIRVPSWQLDIVNMTDPVTGQTLTSGWVPNQDITNSDQVQDTFMAAIQSYFWSDRIVTTLGYRHDELDYSSLATTRNSDGVLELDPNDVNQRDFSANTVSLGAVVHLTDSISAYANHSNSRSLPNTSQRLIGADVPPMPEGIGYDMGLKFDFFGGKLYATVNYYKTDYENTTEWGNIEASVTTLNNRVLAAFLDDGLISESEYNSRLLNANAYLQDRKSDGWEFEAIANPNRNWRITANFSINNVVKSNIMSEVVSWADEATAYWVDTAGEDYLLSGESWDILGDNIGWMMDYINEEVAFNGRQARGEREYGASLYTRYTFTDGFVKGLYIGGGARYQSPNAVTYSDEDVLIEGRDMLLFDLMFGYDFNLTDGDDPVKMSLQLNIANLFDEDKYQIYTTSWWNDALVERLGLQEPRKFTFTTKLSF